MDHKSGLQTDSPEITLPKAQEDQKEHYPTWLLTKDGTVAGANLLAAWIWGTTQLSNLLGVNAGTIFSRNFNRIPKNKNGEFYTKKTATVKRLASQYGIEPYLPFINAILGDPDLAPIYEQGEWLNYEEWESDREWKYLLNIQSPKKEGADTLLTFDVTVYRLPAETGIFVEYKPKNEETQVIIEQEYARFEHMNDSIDYVQYDEKLRQSIFPIISLRINQDPLTARNLATIVSALTEIHTKLWLLQEDRIMDFTLYTHLLLTRFEEEAPLTLSRLSHSSPTWMDLLSKFLTLGGVIAFGRLIDAVVQFKLRYDEKRIAVEKERADALLEIEKKRQDYFIEEVGKVLELMEKHADPETKSKVLESFTDSLTKLGKGEGLDQVLLPKYSETKRAVKDD